MKRISLRNLIVVVSLAAITVNAGILPVAAAVKTAPAPKKAPNADIEPAALTALDQMGAYLRTLNAIQVEAAIQREDVLDSGIKVQFQETARLVSQAPDRLWVSISSDRKEREFFYNGKEFTLWAQRVKYYATVPAPPTTRKLIDTLKEKFGIEMPLVDLFRWGETPASKEGITVAMDIGPGTIGDSPCEQYAFRQKGIDWQLWIQKGDSPLPRKLVITTTTDPAKPQFQATYTWNLTPTIKDADFTFVPPADAQRIVLKTSGSK